MTRRGKRADRLRGRAAKLTSRADALREALEGLNLEELVSKVEAEVVNELNSMFQNENQPDNNLELDEELNRWAELAGLSETSSMASGAVAGGAGVSEYDKADPSRKEDDELDEAKDTSFSDAAEEIERKGTEGVFTAKAKSAGMGVQQYADHVLKKGSGASAKTKKQAAFAKGAATVARENK
jgi:hypothetical protein